MHTSLQFSNSSIDVQSLGLDYIDYSNTTFPNSKLLSSSSNFQSTASQEPYENFAFVNDGENGHHWEMGYPTQPSLQDNQDPQLHVMKNAFHQEFPDTYQNHDVERNPHFLSCSNTNNSSWETAEALNPIFNNMAFNEEIPAHNLMLQSKHISKGRKYRGVNPNKERDDEARPLRNFPKYILTYIRNCFHYSNTEWISQCVEYDEDLKDEVERLTSNPDHCATWKALNDEFPLRSSSAKTALHKIIWVLVFEVNTREMWLSQSKMKEPKKEIARSRKWMEKLCDNFWTQFKDN